ncbi:cupin domain-containing protein [Nocardioides sp. GXZ039]|uniref:cupin domain-containing protein n=1 Tax=Nocardioides sp. GXZ039 TaxID=3136018 RepID=UPI0030F43176
MISSRSSAETRLLCADAHTADLEPDVADGPMPTSLAVLADSPAGIGIWQAEPGTDVDVEAEELFVVLTGRGVVRFEDGSELALAPGAVVQLHAGDRTTWTITEPLRKVYVTLPTG